VPSFRAVNRTIVFGVGLTVGGVTIGLSLSSKVLYHNNIYLSSSFWKIFHINSNPVLFLNMIFSRYIIFVIYGILYQFIFRLIFRLVCDCLLNIFISKFSYRYIIIGMIVSTFSYQYLSIDKKVSISIPTLRIIYQPVYYTSSIYFRILYLWYIIPSQYIIQNCIIYQFSVHSYIILVV
jgi:hypothetical protein